MISSVQNNTNNIFADTHIKTSVSDMPYWLSKNDIKQIKDDSKEAKSHKLIFSIAAGALIVGFGSLALMKGFASKGFGKYLDRIKIILEQKIAGIKDSDTLNRLEEFYIYALRKIDSFKNKAESINNITSWKDVLFQRLMWGKKGDRKVGRKIHEYITSVFERIGRNTVINSYARTDKKFFKLSKKLDVLNGKISSGDLSKKITINGEEKTVKEWLESAKGIFAGVNSELAAGFGQQARLARYDEMKKSVSGLFDYFWDKNFKTLKSLKSKEVWQTFIADDYIKPDKMRISGEVLQLRRKITHDIQDNYNITLKALTDIEKYVNPFDRSSREIIKYLRNSLNSYKKHYGNNDLQKRIEIYNDITENLGKLTQNYKEVARSYNYSENSINEVATYINELKNVLSGSKKGALQELLTIYKVLLPRAEYLKLRKTVSKAVKSLDKSIDIETVQFFDKKRDLVLGSAPTDILSILFSLAAIGLGLSKADNRDERVSVMLKAGIPVVAALGTSLYCSAGLVSGSKALITGLISGAIVNRLGVYVDDMRKKYNATKQNKPHIGG